MELCNGISNASAGNNNLDSGAARDFLRFEPITIRAAVRVIQLQRAGVVSSVEANFYVSELAAMDRHVGPRGAAALARLARRQASLQRISRPHAIAHYAALQGDRRLAMAA